MTSTKLLSILTSLAAVTAVALPGVPASADPAPPTVQVRPGQLDRGAAPLDPYLRGRTVVDGQIRILAPGADPTLVGRGARTGYLVTSENRAGDRQLVLVGRPGGNRVLEADLGRAQVTANADTRSYALVRSGARRSTITVRPVGRGGDVLSTSRVFKGEIEVLDLAGSRVALGGPEIGTRVWDATSGDQVRTSPRMGYEADLRADRLATYDADPYVGGCSMVSTISDATTALWDSCEERVLAFSPGGTKVATTDLIQRSAAVNPVTTRTIDGTAITRYRAGYTFDDLAWESERALVLGVYGVGERGALVRCGTAVCKRVSDVMDLDWT